MIEAIMLWIIKWSLIICLICFVLICVVSGIARIIEKKTGVKIIDETPDPEEGAEAYYSADSYVGGGLQADDGMQAEGECDTGDVWTKDELETMAEAFVALSAGIRMMAYTAKTAAIRTMNREKRSSARATNGWMA